MNPDGLGVGHEIRTLLWLQWRLLRRAFTSTRARDRNRTFSLAVLTLVLGPELVLMSFLLALFLRGAHAGDVAQVLSLLFTYMFVMWLFAPASGQQVFEPLNLPKLFIHPVSFRGLALGSLALGAVSVATLVSLPILTAVWVGASRGGLGNVLVGLSLAVFLGLLVVAKAIMNDLLDLIVEDRRLRNLFTAVAVLPWLTISLVPTLIGSRAGGKFTWQALLDLKPLNWLGWLPSGWLAHGIWAAAEGRWGTWLLSLGLLCGLIAVGARIHQRLLARLYVGDLAPVRQRQARGSAADRLTGDAPRLPGLSVVDSRRLAALMRKDWLNMRRNPLLPRLAFLPIMFSVFVFMLTRNLARSTADFTDHPLVIGLAVGTLIAFLSIITAPNALAFLDHRGLGTLLQLPVPRPLIILSQSLVQLVSSSAIVLGLACVAGFASGRPAVAAVTFGVSFLTLLVFMGVASVTSVASPYYVDIERGRASASGAAPLVGCGMFLVMLLLTAPIHVALGLTWLLAAAQLPLAAAGVTLYALTVYTLLLAAAGRLFPRQEEKLLIEVVEGR